MKIIYEKEIEKIVEGKKEKEIKEVTKKEATHKHLCYHDEKKGRPCKRVKL
jgi:hypothetical protein